MPTSVATFSPTRSIESILKSKLQSILLDFVRNESSSIVYDSQFFALNIIGDEYRMASNCKAWSSFLKGDLKQASASYLAAAIIVKNVVGISTVQNTMNFSSETFTCNSSSIVKEIVGALTIEYLSVSLLQKSCNGHQWTIYSCNSYSYPAICIDCKDPCAQHVAAGVEVNPCQPSPPLQSGIILMDVEFSNRFYPPIIKTLNFSSSNSTVSIVSVLSAKGEFYCAAFISSVTPTLYADITSQNYHSVTNNINKVQATISGLMASTTYKLFCLTAQFGAMTPFSEVLNKPIVRSGSPRPECYLVSNLHRQQSADGFSDDSPLDFEL